MKNVHNSYKKVLLVAPALLILLGSCTKLKESFYGAKGTYVTPNGVGVPGPISGVYNGLNQLVGQGNWFAMQEHSTDEYLGPTRGTDWDDFGTWRKLHLHTWDGTHNQVTDTWNGLNGALYQATLNAEGTTGEPQAEAQFLRAYFMYLICDMYGQVPYVPATAKPSDLGTVLTRSQAVDFMIKDLDAAIPVLPGYTHATRNVATAEAAMFLEAKIYLNKAVYKQDTKSPAGPYTFDANDMNKVITLTNSIAANPNLSIAANYWDNFTWDNGTKSTENIFVRQNSQGINVVWATCMGFHYNQAPSGWNGFTTLSDFYNAFNASDSRRGMNIPGYTDQVGTPAGFLKDTIHGPQGGHIGNPIVALKDRSGNPLIFTPDVSLFFSTETKGIRVVKYPLDPSTINGGGWSSTNEFVFFRLSDARLMKAEALLRGGSDPNSETALGIVNGIRANRGGVGALGSIDLPGLLAERGRELYLEAWRRNDLIRYGVFNQPVGERPTASDPSRVVYPIPLLAISANPNLKQNPGY